MLTDVDKDFPSLEGKLSVSLPASENLESNLSACENSNITYAAAAASTEVLRVNKDDTLVSRNYRYELFLTSFESENFHPDNVMPEQPCTAHFQSDVFTDSTANLHLQLSVVDSTTLRAKWGLIARSSVIAMAAIYRTKWFLTAIVIFAFVYMLQFRRT